MNEQTITVTLPNSICDRIRMTAQAASLTSEEVIKQTLVLAFEADISPNLQTDLTKPALSDEVRLRKVADSVMDGSRQACLEELAELQKHRALTEVEQSELDSLVDEARQIMLRKAQARRILAQRGHTVFTKD